MVLEPRVKLGFRDKDGCADVTITYAPSAREIALYYNFGVYSRSIHEALTYPFSKYFSFRNQSPLAKVTHSKPTASQRD